MEPLDTVLDTWRWFAMKFSAVYSFWLLALPNLPLVVASRSTPGEVSEES